MSYLDTKGRIFDIQRFSVHDGPGVRTIVFLKGCILRCKWCCNPESQSYEIQQMETGGKVKTVGEDITAREVLEIVDKDRIYYRRSGGGLTLSGGESLVQHEFALALLKGAKEMGINTAIETTSCAEYSVIKKLLPYIDTYLMDIKHVNSDKHREFTGRDNGIILENAKQLAKEAKHLIIRVPVIPTFNDTPEEIYAIASYAKEIGVEEIHLLPYHRLGTDKYKGLGREYMMSHVDLIPKDKIDILENVAASTGLIVKIGG
ncbi:MAG: glycyl-radical enzyme activating protein [Ruminococcaceae bacterium]|nr:glycyl-radical enzyme activating protein [Oscillospiraceae bacterium]